MEIQTRVENGKAYLQFAFSPTHVEDKEKAVLIQVKDREDRTVLNCFYPFSEEEPAEGILLHPHLWNGMEEPYLYHVDVHFTNAEGEIKESRRQLLALYTLEEIPGKGLFLNGKLFETRAVYLDLETIKTWEGVAAGAVSMKEAGNIPEQLRKMGANTICLSEESLTKALLQLCMEKGFLVCALADMGGGNEQLPACSELFSSQPYIFTDTYYRYKARWSKEPFIHICMNSIKKQENGCFSMTVYSNQKKIALYVNGVLFEFRNGGEEYFFEEIPVKKYPSVLTAEAGECNTAVTIYERSQNFHRNVTFS